MPTDEPEKDTRPGLLDITFESAYTGVVRHVSVEPRASIRWLCDKAQAEMELSSKAATGAYKPFPVRWVLVDKDAETVWSKLGREEQRRLYALIRTSRGLRFCISERDCIEDLEIYSGIVLRLYSVDDEKEPYPAAKYGF